jgi:hypothetical protein
MFNVQMIQSKSPKDCVDAIAADIRRGMPAGMIRAAAAAEAVEVSEAPVVTGNLRKLITSYVKGEGADVMGFVVPTAPYSEFVHRGTGIYGPYGVPITPKTAKALAFSVGGVKVIRKSVKGQKPNPFVTRTRDRLQREAILGQEFWTGFNAAMGR